MSNLKQQKTAIVTGASKGIGAEIAIRLAADGHAVVINYAQATAEADGVVEKIRAAGGRAIAVKGDVAALDCARSMYDIAECEFGPVDVFVNNAGMLRKAPLAQSDDEMFERVVSVNLGGYFRGMRESARRIRDGGRVINISTSVIGFYHPEFGVYAATKGGIDAMTRILAKELGPRQVTVNAVAPGQVETALFLEGRTEEELRYYADRVPLGRLGQPTDIAGIVAFLAGPEAGWLSGQVIRVNGGGV
ncbi:SDR family oxidoreductase [Variovorax beijingensis]|uniref:SDR family oxidoreductase n=1 Tax=Variovorax beijingensis TaxID=2496117 RepID=A0A3P3EK68_9BURK|nr:SDR family oxidoreductase [Variovorax beijingensis]RRH86793.1 SDR family oxidoreductase [Variovorax beijingensis]RSZ32838.1 SDR family oxidoreductase [Variovorax beijingensis]